MKFTIQPDKCLHFIGGAVIALVVSLAAVIFGLPVAVSALLGVGATVAAGAYKEWVYDAKRPATHTVDVLDFWATFAGGVAGEVVFLFTALLLR